MSSGKGCCEQSNSGSGPSPINRTGLELDVRISSIRVVSDPLAKANLLAQSWVQGGNNARP